MNQLSDEQIVNSVLNGDTEAFSELITRYNNRVFAVGMRLFKNQDDAGDFTQEVFIRAFDKLGLFSFISPFSHWLIKLAYNYGINLLKKKKKEIPSDKIEITSKENQSESYSRKELAELVRSAVDTLPEDYRICVDLFFYWDMKLTDISALTNKPLNTVKSNVRRAKIILRDKLKGTIAEEYHEL